MKNLLIAFIFFSGTSVKAVELNYAPDACKDVPPVAKANEAEAAYHAAMKETDEAFMKELRETNRQAAFLVSFGRDLLVYKANQSAQKVFEEGERRGLSSTEEERLLTFCMKLAAYSASFLNAAKSFIPPATENP
jgi:hypothetical protein